VVDEFGALQGIVTRTDLLETVAGDLPKIDAPLRPKITQREDGSYLIDASVPFSDVLQLIGMSDAVSSSHNCMNCRSREITWFGLAGASRWSTWTVGAST
jgi:CBS domain containing-hemolysin-like protein